MSDITAMPEPDAGFVSQADEQPMPVHRRTNVEQLKFAGQIERDLGLPRGELRRQRAPCHEFPGGAFYLRSEVEAWLAGRTVDPTQQQNGARGRQP